MSDDRIAALEADVAALRAKLALLETRSDREIAFHEAYEVAITKLLPRDCAVRLELAAVIGWSAMCAVNTVRMARGTGRSRTWLIPRLKQARELVREFIDPDDYLAP